MAFWEGIADRIASIRRKKGDTENITPEDLKKNLFPLYWDPDGSKLIKEMDEAGIDLAIVLPLDFGIGLGEAPVSIHDQNKKISEIARRNPDRLIPFVGVDPRREEAVDLLETGVKEWGCQGLKIHPAAGFYPNDKVVYPLYQKAAELSIPILSHTGGIIPPLRSKYVQPIYLDDVVVDFPNLNLICAHIGFGWWMELNQLVEKHTNVYLDCSGWQVIASSHYEYFCRVLRTTLDISGKDKVLFGTDGPAYRLTPAHNKDYVKIIKNLPNNPPGTIQFTEEEIAGVMGRNAKMLFGVL